MHNYDRYNLTVIYIIGTFNALMKNTIVLGLLSTVALFAIGAIGNSNASVR
jgi:hypothetical protein